MRHPTPVIVLLGKLGHGKTTLLNKLTGKRHPCNAGARSCTRTLQHAPSLSHDIEIVDTPGFYASDDVAAHIGAQKLALESAKLSGIYIVVRYSRADEIAEMMTKIMDFVGDDDVRIILTHGDVARGEEGYDPEGMKEALNELLGIRGEHITVVGKDTSGESVEAFVHGTLHEPRSYVISESQLSIISSLCVGTRRINKPIDEVMAKIQAATNACHELVRNQKGYDTDMAIATIQNATSDMVNEAKCSIFQAATDLNEQQQNLVYGKAGLALSLHLKQFMESTNRCLSWDVTDPTDSRNQYKSCPHCGAVFNKTEGCDGETTCGAVPRDFKRPKPRFLVHFKDESQRGWVVQCFLDGAEIMLHLVPARLAEYSRQVVEWGGNNVHQKRPGAIIESGCGNKVNWSQMQPVDPSKLRDLGLIELPMPGQAETIAKQSFEANLERHEINNRNFLTGQLS